VQQQRRNTTAESAHREGIRDGESSPVFTNHGINTGASKLSSKKTWLLSEHSERHGVNRKVLQK
jgi:hypothetical protein